MTVLKKVWAWLKRYWFIPVAFKLFLLYAWFTRPKKKDGIVKAFDSSDEAHKKEVDALKEQAEIEKEEKQKEKAIHEHKLKSIEERFEVDLSELDEQKKKELVELSDTNILTLSEEMAKLLGAEHVE